MLMEAALPPVGWTVPGASEQLFEKIAKGTGISAGKTAAFKLEAFIPVWWWFEIFTGFPVGAQSVVSGSFLRILEHFVSLAQFLEFCLGILFLADIGMVFARQFAIGAFDFVLSGGSR